MYLAPLNYNIFFKRIFSDKNISKRFLEDFLDVKIKDIDLLPERNNITDESVIEFDFRCKIDDDYVIIDMQQWYKMDVVQRFYLYHALNTGLQLDGLPTKEVLLGKQIRKVRNYGGLAPVITMIWMVHDSLKFRDDYVQFSMSPEVVVEFIKDMKLWKNPDITRILEERENVLRILGNNAKNLNFIQENKLIFMFQQNIIKNKNFGKYERWFEFAEKTRSKENKADDFKEYQDDEIFLEMIKKLRQDALTDEDMKHIKEEEESEALLRFEDKVYEDGKKEGIKEGIKEGEKKVKIETANKLIKKGFTLDDIFEVTELPMTELIKLQDLNNNFSSSGMRELPT